MLSYYLFSLGCKVNSYENSAVGEELKLHGFSLAERPEDADVIVLNTCSVTLTADQKSRQHISHLRRANPKAILVVMGCYSQGHAEVALSLGADLVLGSSKRKHVFDLIDEYRHNPHPRADVKDSLRHEQYEELGCNAFTESARAYLKVQDGCDNFCSYCLIPTMRGNSRSRDPFEVVHEAKALVLDGYKEIIISGIHIGGYGKDLGDGNYRLPELLEKILAECPGLFRLRISSIEESEIDDRFLNVLKNHPNIANHLHIPLQSGSSSVLKRMKRKYDTTAFLQKLEMIRTIRPDIAITTDVIAGFPDESPEEWRETTSFCRLASFCEIHVFPFSSRPGTFASTLRDLDPQTKKERVRELLSLSKEMRAEYERRFFGKKMEVLYEDFDPKANLVYGHTSNYLLLAVPSTISKRGEIGKIIYGPNVAAD